MALENLVERFVKDAPVCVMLRMAIEHVLAPERVDGVFERLDHAQAEAGLKFSMVADMMGLVAAKMQPSVHAGYQAAIRAAHGIDKVENEVASYYLATEIANAYRGLCIAVPQTYWEKRCADLSPAELAREPIAVARQMHLARYRKHKPSSSNRTKPTTKKNRQHASTARLLNSA